MKQTEIAKAAKTTQPAISNILSGRRRPSWKLAKRLAKATCTKPVIWLEGSPDEIRKAMEKASIMMNQIGEDQVEFN